jgi:hypothetical protein
MIAEKSSRKDAVTDRTTDVKSRSSPIPTGGNAMVARQRRGVSEQ